MRTTLTLDDDVAAQLNRLRDAMKVPFKSVVNDALRRGLQAMAEPERRRLSRATQSVDLGRCLLGQVDDVTEVLEVAEGGALK